MHSDDQDTLAVAADGPLVRANLGLESAIAFVRASPRNLLKLAAWILKGRRYCSRRLAELGLVDGTVVPLSEPMVAALHRRAAQGARIQLVPGGWTAVARDVAARLEIANITVGELAGGRVAQSAGLDTNHPAAGLRLWVRQLRLYQWMKNLLIFVPLLTAHLFTPDAFLQAGLAFLAFGLVASATYIINDLLDLQSDRRHPRKSARPMASGAISALQGLLAALVLLAAGLGLATVLSLNTAIAIAAYVVLTLAYSVTFKTYVLIDVLLLATLFTLRILIGALAIDVRLSFWLLAFSIFTFLSLALVKRASELVTMEKMLRDRAEGRDYASGDRAMISTMGVASGYMSVLVLALFVDASSSGDAYSRPELLWLLCPLMLYWVSRLWLKTGRGEMHDDPLLYSMRDRASWYVFLGMGAVALLAI